ncbi:hypothetical protein AB0M79_12695 [Polymorphospora sp. NPDC051019]|uniref:type IV toxin-antitoxin system AbiEi family antitoxin domain-containing protein n=1 Tax=Polymorphospora sp. NPDC051019 TaxID=3155725 RepID=UPI003442A141
MTPTTAPARLAAVAAAQHGLFTCDQAHRAGFSPFQVRRRLRTGQWRRLLGPVLAPAGVRPGPRLRDAAGLLALGGAVLAGPSAARRHGITVPDRSTCLLVPRADRRTLRGVRLLREDLPPAEVTRIGGVPLTGRARTVFDCLRLLPDGAARALLDEAFGAGWLTPDRLAGYLHRFTGRHGAARLARLARAAGPHPPDR